MRTLDIMHDGEPYDPIKAHEYYLKKRVLKGRHPGETLSPTAHPETTKATSSSTNKLPVHPDQPKQTAAQLKASTDAKVAALQKKLATLRETLRELVAQAQAKSGVEKTSPTDKKTAAKDKKPTAAEKSKAKAAAHSYYEKHKATTSAQKIAQLNKQIKQVQDQIMKMKADLAAAAKKAKAKKPRVETAAGR